MSMIKNVCQVGDRDFPELNEIRTATLEHEISQKDVLFLCLNSGTLWCIAKKLRSAMSRFHIGYLMFRSLRKYNKVTVISMKYFSNEFP